MKGLGNFEFPVSGGTIAPDAGAGIVQTVGGVVLAEVLDGFVKVYEGYLRGQGKTAEEAKPEQIVAGDPLGTFSFTVQTQ